MSYDGWIHEKQARIIARWGSIASLPLLLLVPSWIDAWQVVLGWICGLWMGFWVTPDLDHTAMTREEYRANRTALGSLWLAYTSLTLYSFIFPHRSVWSHSVIGSFIRMIWLIAPIAVIVWLALSKIGFGVKIPWSWGYVSFTGGWLIQDMQHYRQDGLGALGLKKWI